MLLRRFLYDRPHDLPRDVGGACSAHYKTMINWASLILLLFSVSLLTTQSHCAQTSPGLFYLVLVLSLLGYLCLTALLILWFFVLFCLNGLVAVLELFGVGSRVMQWQGATPEMIDNIPITKFTRRIQPTITPQEQEQQHQQPLSQTVKDPETVAMPSIVVSDEGIGSYSTRLEELSSNVVIEMEPSTEPAVEVQHKQAQEQEQEQGREQDKEKEKEQEEENEHPTQMLSLEHLSPEERELALRISTSCPICLCDYEDLEELRHLPCDHFFHKECVDEWLKLKRTCPLCKCDIAYRRRGSKLWSRRSNGRGHGRQRSSGSRRFSFGPRRTTQ
ncbi:hypothetical protein BCR41DRAFT_243067 [Lobosporangium transversale]|uniref:RING-type E3 ubiquitin transferase n=1 Tax=Lobosporangium transversale TaxID=64571 RepID=A0A1Y2G566_9FUNG|nr:hypothetical protein BCR41DRAFT_243067 [Lobosporangium transversale]ORY94297.1 hypothetical protein BCR41DRAFT_243067 [Lobosporangium transversale]|eukprot:XP_021875240.1 hypothetical protein BCR41DRAFT_243067 [Lobosporangium transversale]